MQISPMKGSVPQALAAGLQAAAARLRAVARVVAARRMDDDMLIPPVVLIDVMSGRAAGCEE
jgi:hypothetical protein